MRHSSTCALRPSSWVARKQALGQGSRHVFGRNLDVWCALRVQTYQMEDPTEVPEKRFERPSGGIYDAVDLWCTDQAAAEAKYGHIRAWDTSRVTIMRQLFAYKNDFNEDIGDWDMSNVTTTFRSEPAPPAAECRPRRRPRATCLSPAWSAFG